MKWKHIIHGTKRVREGFLFLPRVADRESRWLEKARWVEYWDDILKDWVCLQWLDGNDPADISRNLFALLLLTLLSSCGPEPTTEMKDALSYSGKRFSVEQVAIFEDRLAYRCKRGIYIIKDRETGQEFIGVSGVGISEVGTHSSGKHSQSQDER